MITKTTAIIGTLIILFAGSVAAMKWQSARSAALEKKGQENKITMAADQIKQVNAAFPDLQVQAKTLIFAALIQKKIPAAPQWCETLNVGGKLWPATPTNTSFAINSAVAGRVYSKTNRLAGDAVVFFETSHPGWNLAGGAELMASRPEGVTIALADGRTLMVTPAEAGKLRWNP